MHHAWKVAVILASLYMSLGHVSTASSHAPSHLSRKMMDEIASYQDVVAQIVNYTVSGAGQNQSYNRLALFTDKFGSRISGQL